MEPIRCARCDATRDPSDNFCRTCGHQFSTFSSSQLPVVQHRAIPATRSRGLPIKSLPASFVGSMAVLAVGTGLEWAARRIVPSAAKAAGRAIIGQERFPPPRGGKGAKSVDDISVDEVLYVRKIQMRR